MMEGTEEKDVGRMGKRNIMGKEKGRKKGWGEGGCRIKRKHGGMK